MTLGRHEGNTLMKAIVLAGGTGSRLRPISVSMPKQLIPVANRPVLEHVLSNLRDAGIHEIGVVVGDQAPKIVDAIGDGSRLGISVTYIPQDAPRGLAHCVIVSREFLGDDDFVMYLGDNMLPDGITDIAAQFRRLRPAAQLVVQKVSDPRQFGVAELDGDGRVLRLVEKPKTPTSDLALIGVYFFTPVIHDAVTAINPSARGELEITDALQLLVSRGAHVQASVYDGYWKDVGGIGDLLECNRHLLAGRRGDIAGLVDAASEVDPFAVVEAGARVVRSRIDGLAVIGAGTLIEDSHIGPNTAIGRDCVIRDSFVSDSIVLDQTRITAMPSLRESIIGRGVTIGPSGSGRRTHRMLVGDHTHIELAA